MASGWKSSPPREFLSGRVLAVTNNGTGQAQSVTMWVGETGADLVSDVDTIQTINISAVTQYEDLFLRRSHSPTHCSTIRLWRLARESLSAAAP